jgi:menaquinone reductase, integral membrane subunit
MDERLLTRGQVRAPFARFVLWLAPWLALLGLGLYAGYLCLARGLNQTHMDNRFAFGLWIYLDLTVIALGAGAFMTGFLVYVLRKSALKAVINHAVALGLICYSGAVLILMIDVGQPLRAWFTFWHPNVHSMLTEVTFCLTCYLIMLAIEYAPLVLRHRQVRRQTSALLFEFQLHKQMIVFALVGAFLSFFHQGSLGGLYGVLQGRPFAFREGIGVWPSTFFLFILSAAAVGPSFVLLAAWIVSRLARRPLVAPGVFDLLGRISGWLLLIYVLLKSADTVYWLTRTAPALGASVESFYAHPPFGLWVLFLEILGLGLLPAAVLISPLRRHPAVLASAAALACAGLVLNRYIATVQTLALPTLAFDEFVSYVPSWQEVGSFAGVVAYGVIVYSLSFRYLNLFPQERELVAR